jgi:hypothetical protein
VQVDDKITILRAMLVQCDRLREDREDMLTAVSMDRVRAIVVDLLNEVDVLHFDMYPPAAWDRSYRATSPTAVSE